MSSFFPLFQEKRKLRLAGDCPKQYPGITDLASSLLINFQKKTVKLTSAEFQDEIK